jgi:uncharacterized protein YejL (UPF0352 family)
VLQVDQVVVGLFLPMDKERAPAHPGKVLVAEMGINILVNQVYTAPVVVVAQAL